MLTLFYFRQAGVDWGWEGRTSGVEKGRRFLPKTAHHRGEERLPSNRCWHSGEWHGAGTGTARD